MSPMVGAVLRPPASTEASAWGLLQRAQGLVQKWPEGFRGYQARVRCDVADRAREGVVTVACGPASSVELELPGLQELIRTRLLEHVDERTPRFFKDGDGRFTVRSEAERDGERWIRVERPEATVRYRLDARGRIDTVQRLEHERETLTVIEEYARATPGRVLPARRRTTTHDRRTGTCLAREHVVEAHCRIDSPGRLQRNGTAAHIRSFLDTLRQGLYSNRVSGHPWGEALVC